MSPMLRAGKSFIERFRDELSFGFEWEEVEDEAGRSESSAFTMDEIQAEILWAEVDDDEIGDDEPSPELVNGSGSDCREGRFGGGDSRLTTSV